MVERNNGNSFRNNRMMPKLNGGRNQSVALLLFILLITTIFSGCTGKIEHELDEQTRQVLQNAIDSLNNQPGAWKSTMDDTITKLGEVGTESATAVLADVQSTYDSALGQTESTAFCGADFIGRRLEQRMQAILHKFDPNVSAPTIVPVVCITNPDHVDAGPNPPQTQLLKYYGYDFLKFKKTNNFTADLEYKSGQIVKPSFGSVNVATDYMLTLNIQAEDYATVDRNQYPAVVLKWGDQKVSNDTGQSALPVLFPPVTPIPQEKSCGPFGGGGGVSFSESFKTLPIGVVIFADTYVNSIQMIYSTGPGDRWGGGGGESYSINLNPGEYIQGIGVRNGYLVDSITIYTNLRTFGPYGGSGGTEQPVCGEPGWQVTGIFGRSGELVDAIGLTLQRR